MNAFINNNAAGASGNEPGLVDVYGRVHDYLRLSVTDKCNLRCRYCMPPQGVTHLPHGEVLMIEEFLRLMALFTDMGVTKIRFTGGEPLVRRGFMELLSGARSRLGGTELCLTTNGILLGPHIAELQSLGVRKLNISIDTLSADRYLYLTGRDELAAVKGSFEKAVDSGFFDLKVNAVLFEETIHELDAILDYYRDKNVTLRFIERMPLNGSGSLSYVGADRLLEALERRGVLSRNGGSDTRVACMYDFRYRDRHPMKIGVIPPLTNKFCARCNRIRITCNGSMKTCLYGNDLFDVKRLLRGGAGDGEIKSVIRKALLAKAEGHTLDCGDGGDGCASLQSMSDIGG